MKPAAIADVTANGFDSPADRSRRSSSVGVALDGLRGSPCEALLHGKRWMVIAGMCVLCRSGGRRPGYRADVPSVELEFDIAFMFIPQAILPLLATICASGLVRDEQEELTYLLIRPVPKWALYSLKLFATLTTAVLLVVMLTLLTYVAIYAGGRTSFREVAPRVLRGIDPFARRVHLLLPVWLDQPAQTDARRRHSVCRVFEGLLANLHSASVWRRLSTLQNDRYRTLTFFGPLADRPFPLQRPGGGSLAVRR